MVCCTDTVGWDWLVRDTLIYRLIAGTTPAFCRSGRRGENHWRSGGSRLIS
jgi:hypothetical protein